MTIHEFGKENEDILVMIHPLGVWWTTFEFVRTTLEKHYHLIIPALPGHDPEKPHTDFTSVEDIDEFLTEWLLKNGYSHVKCLYGCSMGGGLVIRMLADNRIKCDFAVIDAGMTPYQLPKPVTYMIGVRDFLMTLMGKYGSIKMLSSVFDPSKYSKEDLLYIKTCLSSLSAKTIWRGFYSANNYSMPDNIREPDCKIQYWYGDEEAKERGWDIEYVKKIYPKTVFVENKGQDHAEFFSLHPEEFCIKLLEFIGNEKPFEFIKNENMIDY